MHRLALARVVPALFLAASLSAAGCHKEADAGADSTQAAKKPSATTEAPVANVELAPVDERPMPEYLLVTGTLLPNQESKVAAGVSGKVLSTYVERGSSVKRGQALVQLDTRTVSANLAEANAAAQTARTQREQAKADCERSKVLFEKGAASKAEFDRQQTQCQATISQAEAAEARARSVAVNFGDASAIRAPFSGSIAERNVSAGEYVQAATVVATVVELDPLRLELSVPEAAVAEMKDGLKVEFHLASDDNKKFDGTIRYVGPAVRRSSRDLIVEAVVDNKEHALLPGMFASARVHTGDPKRTTVPESAIRLDGSLHHLFVAVDGKAEDRIVQVGAKKDGRVAVLDGIKAGEQVVTNPAQIVDGQALKAVAAR